MKNSRRAPRQIPKRMMRAGSFCLAAFLAGCAEEPGSRTAAKPQNNALPMMASTKPDSKASVEGHAPLAASAGAIEIRAVTPEEFKKVVADQHGKVVLADFWATYCVPCRQDFPKTLALAKKYAGEGLTVVSMSMDSPDPDDQRKVRQFLEEQHSQVVNLANRLEDSDKAFGELGIDGGALPHYKVYGRHGKLRAKFGGDPDHPFDEKDIEKAVVAALAEK